MALNDVSFITLNGGLGRTLAGDDSISGMVLPVSTQPSGATKTAVFNSLQEAVTFGILPTGATAHAHYQIAQFYAQVSATLYVTFAGANYAADMDDLQNLAVGNIKQVAVVGEAAFATSTLSALQAAADAQIAQHRGLSILYSTTSYGSLTLATLPTLATMNLPNVSTIISADANRSYSCAGASLGVLASASVAENFGALLKFNMVKGTEFDTVKFLTGENFTAVNRTAMNGLKDKGYIFLTKFTGIAGTFHSDSNTATATTSDYHYIENTRTMEKAQRSLRTALLPQLMSNLYVEGGKLTLPTVSKFTIICQNRLDQMKNAGEISDYKLFIDANQNVISTSKLAIQVGITPVGIARMIEVSMGFQL